MKTQFPTKQGIERLWFVIDAENKVLGRLATQVARVLIGKHRARYTPFIDAGDHVIVVNAQKVKLTGAKEDQKMYRHHTGYPGGLKEAQAKKVRAERPIKMVEEAIRGMLPKNKLGKQMFRKLNVYAGDKHPHESQKPVPMDV
ncbi:MAG: 50S ribosomal protein L13 [Candidatus Solibacter usitatus]|nr:50S ribosomal protein L13 [Candidatus Solibacter usitatus]